MKLILGKCSCGQWDRLDQFYFQGSVFCFCLERGWSCLVFFVEFGYRVVVGGKLFLVTSFLFRFFDGSCGWGVVSRERAGYRRGYGLFFLGVFSFQVLVLFKELGRFGSGWSCVSFKLLKSKVEVFFILSFKFQVEYLFDFYQLWVGVAGGGGGYRCSSGEVSGGVRLGSCRSFMKEERGGFSRCVEGQ